MTALGERTEEYNREKFDGGITDGKWVPRSPENENFQTNILPWALSLPEGSIMDLAGGVGLESNALKQEGFNVTLVDISQDLLANSTHDKKVRAEIQNLPFPDNSFSGVLLKDVWMFLRPELRVQTLQEIKRVLKPGGSILLISQTETAPRLRYIPEGMSYPVKETFKEQFELDEAIQNLSGSRDKIVGVDYISTVSDAEAYAQQAGFAIVHAHEYDDKSQVAQENRWIKIAGFVVRLEKPVSEPGQVGKLKKFINRLFNSSQSPI